MKIQHVFLAALVVLASTTATAKPDLKAKKPCSKNSALLLNAKRLALMLGAGSVSFFIGDVAIDALVKLSPSSHKAFKSFPSKVAFPILGALGVWLVCKAFYGDDCDAEVSDSISTGLTGLPKKDKDADDNSSMPVCMGGCC